MYGSAVWLTVTWSKHKSRRVTRTCKRDVSKTTRLWQTREIFTTVSISRDAEASDQNIHLVNKDVCEHIWDHIIFQLSSNDLTVTGFLISERRPCHQHANHMPLFWWFPWISQWFWRYPLGHLFAFSWHLYNGFKQNKRFSELFTRFEPQVPDELTIFHIVYPWSQFLKTIGRKSTMSPKAFSHSNSQVIRVLLLQQA